MWRLTVVVLALGATAAQNVSPKSGDELVSSVLKNCADMDCVKTNVLGYLDNILKIDSDARSAKNIDAAIFKRAAKVLKTHEFRLKLPEMIFDKTEIVYNPKTGLDVATTDVESRGLFLKKKILLPFLLLLKLKMKALMPIFVALIGLKSLKALILSKLAILIVLGFIIYQFVGKNGMPMPMSMSMAPAEPPASMYGPPTTAPPSSYEPGWEPNQGGPYSRVWTNDNSAQNLAYSAYYPGPSSSTTSRP
ncbi:uncharacterized protein Osi20 [Tribolium castaneum]|uniref:Osiris 20 n=1 Tax=Tribolium castaneum TaxID=7070 RepID=D6X0X0_TRICA|nr:PREDICTED: uncharacterized protein LOC657749 [Tribolium castaneum]EFA10567.1 hypothetical protein TcasGA2_TC012823 [Tribolium castaneum]|eukprot:XP_969284.1 PREDICTED: uncharacterized protein LOC657749 [Tribolium castaneum]